MRPMAQWQIVLVFTAVWPLCGSAPTLAEDDVSGDSCSLLQVEQGSKLDQRVRVERDDTFNAEITPASFSAAGRCMKFMHIPKTGGTSIDYWGMKQTPPVFDSFMREMYKRMAKGIGPERFESEFHSNLGVMYAKSHANRSHYNKFAVEHEHHYRMISQPDLGSCEDVHAPPFEDPAVAGWYMEGECNVFCAVRNPLKRFISSYQMNHVGPCDPAGFESAIRKFLPLLEKKPTHNGCLFTPQVHFVFGAQSKQLAAKQYCKHIVHTEHLGDEFAALMMKLGGVQDPPKLPRLFTAKEMGGCKVDTSKLTQAAKDLIYEHFRADFEAFGYPRP